MYDLGLLHVGDVIKEVNGIPVSTPEQLMDIIRSTDAGITLKIIQNYTEQQPQAQVCMSIGLTECAVL
jgi:PDZ domain-containing secreted protein